MPTVTLRMTAEARKQQIVQVALETIAEHGVQGATIARIAKGAGITSAALYAHFENRHAILLAALDVVYEKVFESHRWSNNSNGIERLREMCEHHAEMAGEQAKTGHAHLFLEFVAAAAEEGLREALREKELAAADDLALVVEECKRQGTLPQSVDSRMVAWLIAGWAWTGDVANLMGVSSEWHPRVSSHLLDLILASVSATAAAPAIGRIAGNGGHGKGGALRSDGAISEDGGNAAVASVLDLVGRGSSPSEAGLDDVASSKLPEEAVFTVEEVASIFRVAPRTVYDLARQGQIPSLSLGRSIRIPRRAVVALLAGTAWDEPGAGA